MREHVSITHPGLKRTENEDSCGMFPIGKHAQLYVVCDGIGGGNGGKEASALALSVFSSFILSQWSSFTAECWDSLSLAQIKRVMRAAASEASRRVRAAARENPALEGMGSTLVAALLTESRAYVIHVGDSRLYTVTEHVMGKVTRDHSYIQYLVDIGRVTKQQAKELHIQNYITQAIGAYDHADGDFCALDLSADDRPTYLLLCSDGLHAAVRKDVMHRILLSDRTLPDKAQALVDAALACGGEDNITAVIVRI